MAKLVLDEPVKKPRLVLDEPDYEPIFVPKEKPAGAFEYNEQLDNFLSNDDFNIEDLMPLDAKYDFGHIVGMTTKPDETKEDMKNALYYSVQFGLPPSVSYPYISNIIDKTRFNPVKAESEDRGFFGKVAESWRRGDAQVMGDISVYETAFEGMGNEEQALALLKKMRLEQALDPIEGRFLAELVYSGVNVLPGMARGYWSAIPNAFAGMAAGAGMAAAAGQVPPLTLAPEELGTVPAGLLTGGKIGLMTGSALFWYKQGAGSMYATMRENDYDPELSKFIAGAAAVPYAIVEFLQVSKLTPGLRREALQVAQKSMLGVLKNAAKRYGQVWSTEVAEEVVQEIIQVVAEDTAGLLSDKLKIPKGIGEFLLKRGQRIWETLKESGKAMAVVPMLPGATIDIYTGKRLMTEAKAKAAKATELAEAKAPKVVEVKAPEAVVKPTEAPIVVTKDEIQTIAQNRLDQLERISEGIPAKEEIGFPGEPARFFTAEERAEYQFLKENIDNPEALAQGYNVEIVTKLEKVLREKEQEELAKAQTPEELEALREEGRRRARELAEAPARPPAAPPVAGVPAEGEVAFTKLKEMTFEEIDKLRKVDGKIDKKKTKQLAAQMMGNLALAEDPQFLAAGGFGSFRQAYNKMKAQPPAEVPAEGVEVTRKGKAIEIGDAVTGTYIFGQDIQGIVTDRRFSTIKGDNEVTYTVTLTEPMEIQGSMRERVNITLDVQTGLGDEQSLSLARPTPAEAAKPEAVEVEKAKKEIEQLRIESARLEHELTMEEGKLSSLRAGRDIRGKITEAKKEKWRAELGRKEREVKELRTKAVAAEKAYRLAAIRGLAAAEEAGAPVTEPAAKPAKAKPEVTKVEPRDITSKEYQKLKRYFMESDEKNVLIHDIPFKAEHHIIKAGAKYGQMKWANWPDIKGDSLAMRDLAEIYDEIFKQPEVTKVEKPKEPTKPGVSLLGGLPVEAPGLTRDEVSHLGRREQDALRAAQKRGLKVGYKKGVAETVADTNRTIDALKLKDKLNEKDRMDMANMVLTYIPKEYQGRYMRRVLNVKTPKSIDKLTTQISEFVAKHEKRQAIKAFKKFVKDIKKKYRRGEVALGLLPKKTGDAIIETLDQFDLAKITEKKEETLESRLKFVTRISGALAKGFEELTPELDKDATDYLVMGTRRIEELKRLSQEFIGELDTDEIKYIHASLDHLIKINDLKSKPKERRRIENLRTDINAARQEVLPAKAEVKSLTGVLGALRWVAVEGSSTLRTLVGLSSGKENPSMTKLLVDELDEANNERKTTYQSFIMNFRKIAKQKGLKWSEVSNLDNLTKITIGGKSIDIDYDNLLALYGHTQAEGNLTRLLKTKGLNITVYSKDKNGILTRKHIYRVGTPTLEELRAIADLVPKEHKKLLGIYFQNNQEVQAPAINETSMAHQNYELARKEKYLHLSREIERVTEGKKSDLSISIDQQGRYLPRTGGTARINIRPFSLEVMNSMQSDAAYHAMTIPMENARTLVASTKWREAMKRAGQQRALNEITRMLRRIQGLISDQSVIELTASRLLGTVGKSILSLRISGGMVQTASVPVAVEFIKKEYLSQIDIPSRKLIQHLKDISPTLWMRWEGKQFDYALGMVGAENAFEALLFEHVPVTNKLLTPYTVGDEIAIGKLYMAAERQIEAETNLKRGTDEFEQASLELLYKALNTQPQWDMLHRSPVTSDPSLAVRSMTMFMSARNAQLNVAIRAIDDYRKGRITQGQLSERLGAVGMSNMFVSVARHTFKTAVKAGAIAFFTALGLRKPPDEDEIKKEAVKLATKIPTETVFNIIGLNVVGSLFTSMGYAALKARKYGWKAGRYSDIRTGNMMADLMLDFMQTGVDFTLFTDQLLSGEKYKTGKNRGRYKWEITGLKLIDDIALLIAYRFGLPYEGPKSDILWPAKAALKAGETTGREIQLKE